MFANLPVVDVGFHERDAEGAENAKTFSRRGAKLAKKAG
jgi:hypothetical protein